MFAARNILLCTKDCACLMVCPTGATDTENGQIDETKCLDGCRLCVDACPSHAIYLVSTKTIAREKPAASVSAALDGVLVSMAKIHHLASGAANSSETFSRFMKALAHSSRVLGEDCWREKGYLSLDPERIQDFMASNEAIKAYEESGGKAPELKATTEKIFSAVEAGIDL